MPAGVKGPYRPGWIAVDRPPSYLPGVVVLGVVVMARATV
jgi:hypothetical protein